MGIDRHTYIGPYAIATKRPCKLDYENLACPNKKCRSNKKPDRMETITIKFCQDCGTKLEMQKFQEDYNVNFYEFLQDNKIKGERLSEVDSYENDQLKDNQTVLITNVKFKHSKHIDESESIIVDFLGDKDQSKALAEFRDVFEPELKILHGNYDDIDYCYGLLSWFS